MDKVFIPENNNNDLATLLAVSGNRFGSFGGNGWGGGVLGFILGLLLGNNGLGGGLFGGGNNGFLASQANNNNNTDLLLNAINGTDSDIRLLATTLNTDIAQTTEAIHQVQNAIQSVGAQNGMGFLQVVNAIQSGDASLSRQLCECCCENRLLTTQQGYENRIQTIEQTNQLGSQADRNTRSITDAIAAQTTMITKEFCDLKERELQDKINTLTADNAILRTTMNNNAQTAQVAAMLAPIQAELQAIKAAQPPTITMPFNQYYPVPTLLANGAVDFIASYWANRLSSAITGTTTTTTA